MELDEENLAVEDFLQKIEGGDFESSLSYELETLSEEQLDQLAFLLMSRQMESKT